MAEQLQESERKEWFGKDSIMSKATKGLKHLPVDMRHSCGRHLVEIKSILQGETEKTTTLGGECREQIKRKVIRGERVAIRKTLWLWIKCYIECELESHEKGEFEAEDSIQDMKSILRSMNKDDGGLKT